MNAREDSRGLVEGGKPRLTRMVYLLVFCPVTHLQVSRTVNGIHVDTTFAGQFLQPAINRLAGVVVVRVEKAREESRRCATPALVIYEGPEKDEAETGFARKFTHTLALRELWLDSADPPHDYNSRRSWKFRSVADDDSCCRSHASAVSRRITLRPPK